MPRDVFEMDVQPPVSREEFIKEQKAKARVSRKKGKKFVELTSKRSKNLVIRESAQTTKYMIIRYKKATTGEVKKYKVAPYSFRYMRDAKTGRRRKVLYAYDQDAKHIKAFYLDNIKGVERTESSFKPKWEVEITF